MIGLLIALIALVILGVALVVAAFGTLGVVAAVPIGAGLIWIALVGRSPGDRPSAPESEPDPSEWEPKPRLRGDEPR